MKNPDKMKASKNTAVVTGANGFVGANLTRALVKDGYIVHVALRQKPNYWRLQDIQDKIIIHEVDITNKQQVNSLFKKVHPSHIFHLAAYGAYSHQTDLSRMIDVNIKGLENLLQATNDIPYVSFVITGSSSEYGYKKKPMKEKDILEPTSNYAATKAAATLISQVTAKQYNKPITIVRLFSVYGPYEEPTRFIPVAIKLALQNKQIPLTPGTSKRDFIYIKDVIDAFLLIAKNPTNPGELINLGTGKQYTNDTVIDTIGNLMNKKLNIAKGAFENRIWDTDYWVADNTKAKTILKWEPKYSLENGLKESIVWFTEHAALYND